MIRARVAAEINTSAVVQKKKLKWDSGSCHPAVFATSRAAMVARTLGICHLSFVERREPDTFSYKESHALTRKANPVGYCIYCGARSVELSDEHIVPFALGGDVVLPQASCATCAATTSNFERQVARNVLGPFRNRKGAPARRPKKRPETLTLELVDSDGSRREIELSPSSHPATLLLPDLPEPSILLPALNRESVSSHHKDQCHHCRSVAVCRESATRASLVRKQTFYRNARDVRSRGQSAARG
jgi:hypothetical protein